MDKTYTRNKKSQKIYEVIKKDETHVFLERETDGFAVKVKLSRFVELYESVEREAVDEDTKESEIGFLVEPNERDDFKNMILQKDVLESIEIGLSTINMQEELNEKWGLSHIEPQTHKIALNFYGPPGTGKTMSARAIAKKLKKKLLQVDYSSVISKWVGDTGKHIKQAFTEAKEHDAILFFDEADAMLSKRHTVTDEAVSNSINQNRNILMQELDRFDGMVIFATNLFGNYDEALLRRIARHVEFILPNAELRKSLFKVHLPPQLKENKLIKGKLDLNKLAEETKRFSGGDIKNVVKNAIQNAAVFKKFFNMGVLLFEIEKIQKAKQEHSPHLNRNPIGF